jgi:(R,R)-butanediol dehydrogenase/meso-butanediol dehydrogenase/diacetyl reductase
MKAAVFHEAGKPLSLETFDMPTPRAADVIIRVDRCGICGTDLHMTSGHGWDYPSGFIPGHEFVGEVVELGAEVERFRKGDLITAVPTAGCGHCPGCEHGSYPMCENMEPVPGGFGEFMRIPTRVALKLPSTYTVADGALVEPFAVGLFALRAAQLTPGDKVLVLGAGTVALTTAFWAKRLGASRVVIANRSEKRRSMAEAFAVDGFVQSGGENEIAEVVEALGGAPDVVFECVGASGLLGQAINHVRRFGKVVSAGFCTAPDPILPAICAYKGVQLSFPVGYGLREFEYVADQMLAGAIDPKAMVTAVVPLDELPTVFEALRAPNNETKVHVSMTGA